MWLLGRLLPLMVGQHVPDGDQHWMCFLNVLRIVTVATAIEVTQDSIAILALLIEDYLLQFNSLYHNCITPKMHYLLHLPDQISRYTLTGSYCM
jgi:hypothetical protein